MKTLRLANKKIPLPVVLLFCLILSTAQAQKIKKGIIYYDDQPSGKVDGKLSAFTKADLIFFTMEGTPLMTVKEKSNDFRNPMFTNNIWLAVKFEDTGKEMKVSMPARCFNEKCILNKLEKEGGIRFRGTPVSDQDSIIAKYDYSPVLEADTLAKRSQEKELEEKLKNNYIKRNTREPFQVLLASNAPAGVEAHLIKQGDVFIGRIQKPLQADFSEKKEGLIFERSTNSRDEILAAHLSIEMEAGVPVIYLFTHVDRKWHKKYKTDDTIEREIARYMIDNGYL